MGRRRAAGPRGSSSSQARDAPRRRPPERVRARGAAVPRAEARRRPLLRPLLVRGGRGAAAAAVVGPLPRRGAAGLARRGRRSSAPTARDARPRSCATTGRIAARRASIPNGRDPARFPPRPKEPLVLGAGAALGRGEERRRARRRRAASCPGRCCSPARPERRAGPRRAGRGARAADGGAAARAARAQDELAALVRARGDLRATRALRAVRARGARGGARRAARSSSATSRACARPGTAPRIFVPPRRGRRARARRSCALARRPGAPRRARRPRARARARGSARSGWRSGTLALYRALRALAPRRHGARAVRVVLLLSTRSRSDWNHGNAHFLRGVASELVAARPRGRRVRAGATRWSARNLAARRTATPRSTRPAQPTRSSPSRAPTTSATLDLEAALDGADLVLVHEWNDPAARGAHRRSTRARSPRPYGCCSTTRTTAPSRAPRGDGALRPLAATTACSRSASVLRELYLARGWARRAFTWHEAADVRRVPARCRRTRERATSSAIGNWGDEERTAELHEFLLGPVKRARALAPRVHGVRYPDARSRALAAAGVEYGGWLPNHRRPRRFAAHRVTVHVPRRPVRRGRCPGSRPSGLRGARLRDPARLRAVGRRRAAVPAGRGLPRRARRRRDERAPAARPRRCRRSRGALADERARDDPRAPHLRAPRRRAPAHLASSELDGVPRPGAAVARGDRAGSQPRPVPRVIRPPGEERAGRQRSRARVRHARSARARRCAGLRRAAEFLLPFRGRIARDPAPRARARGGERGRAARAAAHLRRARRAARRAAAWSRASLALVGLGLLREVFQATLELAHLADAHRHPLPAHRGDRRPPPPAPAHVPPRGGRRRGDDAARSRDPGARRRARGDRVQRRPRGRLPRALGRDHAAASTARLALVVLAFAPLPGAHRARSPRRCRRAASGRCSSAGCASTRASTRCSPAS